MTNDQRAERNQLEDAADEAGRIAADAADVLRMQRMFGAPTADAQARARTARAQYAAARYALGVADGRYAGAWCPECGTWHAQEGNDANGVFLSSCAWACDQNDESTADERAWARETRPAYM